VSDTLLAEKLPYPFYQRSGNPPIDRLLTSMSSFNLEGLQESFDQGIMIGVAGKRGGGFVKA